MGGKEESLEWGGERREVAERGGRGDAVEVGERVVLQSSFHTLPGSPKKSQCESAAFTALCVSFSSLNGEKRHRGRERDRSKDRERRPLSCLQSSSTQAKRKKERKKTKCFPFLSTFCSRATAQKCLARRLAFICFSSLRSLSIQPC